VVNLTRIYTRTGDDGTTSLGDFSRTHKTDSRLVAYADVDEANSAIGVALAAGGDELDADVTALLRRVQNDLFDVGADLCTPVGSGDERLRVTEAQVSELEELCDRFNEGLPDLKSFVLPGGSEASARLHVARAVCRRAELAAIQTAASIPIDPLVPVYLNRLSDLLFILARAANAGRDEPLWKPGG
jgi:cob(I)alamin adenosyltransferase